MNTQHTPGPWITREYQDYTGSGVEIAQSGGNPRLYIARDIMGDTLEQSNANARLIAAAPDLLAALNASTIALQDFQREAGIQTHPKLNWQIVENLNVINKAKGATA